MRGRVKWFNAEKGYGFIAQDNGPDVFVHCSEIRGSGQRTLNAGDVVEFDIAYVKSKGKQARNVKPAGNSSPAVNPVAALEEARRKALDAMNARRVAREAYKAGWKNVPGFWNKDDFVNFVFVVAFASVARPAWAAEAFAGLALDALAADVERAARKLSADPNIYDSAFVDAWERGVREGNAALMRAATAATKAAGRTRFENVIIVMQGAYDYKRLFGDVEITPEAWIICPRLKWDGKKWETYPFQGCAIPSDQSGLPGWQRITVSVYDAVEVHDSGGGDAYRDSWVEVTYVTGDPIITNVEGE